MTTYLLLCGVYLILWKQICQTIYLSKFLMCWILYFCFDPLIFTCNNLRTVFEFIAFLGDWISVIHFSHIIFPLKYHFELSIAMLSPFSFTWTGSRSALLLRRSICLIRELPILPYLLLSDNLTVITEQNLCFRYYRKRILMKDIVFVICWLELVFFWDI